MPKGKKPKPIIDEDIKCPWCSKVVKVKVIRKTITPAVPAEKEIEITVEKQQDLKEYGKKK